MPDNDDPEIIERIAFDMPTEEGAKRYAEECDRLMADVDSPELRVMAESLMFGNLDRTLDPSVTDIIALVRTADTFERLACDIACELGYADRDGDGMTWRDMSDPRMPEGLRKVAKIETREDLDRAMKLDEEEKVEIAKAMYDYRRARELATTLHVCALRSIIGARQLHDAVVDEIKRSDDE